MLRPFCYCKGSGYHLRLVHGSRMLNRYTGPDNWYEWNKIVAGRELVCHVCDLPISKGEECLNSEPLMLSIHLYCNGERI